MKKYYVYGHINPLTDDILYVGYGSNHRAWVFNAVVHRQKPHVEFLNSLIEEGFLPCDWVKIFSRSLTKDTAKKLEKELIQLHSPLFNIHKGTGSMTCSTKKQKAKELRAGGLSYTQIQNEMKLGSAMSAWRYVNYE